MPELKIPIFLKADDLTAERNRLTFTDAGEFLSPEETGFKEETFTIGITLPNAEKRQWTMNRTSQRMVAAKYGMNSDAWVNKSVEVRVVPVNVGGVEKKSIIVIGEGQ